MPPTQRTAQITLKDCYPKIQELSQKIAADLKLSGQIKVASTFATALSKAISELENVIEKEKQEEAPRQEFYQLCTKEIGEIKVYLSELNRDKINETTRRYEAFA